MRRGIRNGEMKKIRRALQQAEFKGTWLVWCYCKAFGDFCWGAKLDLALINWPWKFAAPLLFCARHWFVDWVEKGYGLLCTCGDVSYIRTVLRDKDLANVAVSSSHEFMPQWRVRHVCFDQPQVNELLCALLKHLWGDQVAQSRGRWACTAEFLGLNPSVASWWFQPYHQWLHTHKNP